MKYVKKLVSLIMACVLLSGIWTLSYASSVNSGADSIALDGSQIVVQEGTSAVLNENGQCEVSMDNVEEGGLMEFSMYVTLPEDGIYKLTIVSTNGGEYSAYTSILVNNEEISLPDASATSDDGFNTYIIRNAEFRKGTNEIKFSVGAVEGTTSAKTVLDSVTIEAYTKESISGTEYSSHTNNKWVEEKTVDLSAYGKSSEYKYQSYNTTSTPFYAEYVFYVRCDGEYSLTGVMSYFENDANANKYYSTCRILWDGFEIQNTVTSTKYKNEFGENVYSGIMLKEGMHTLRIVSLPRNSDGQYNLYVGDLALQKTGDYAETDKQIEIMGNEYSSLGGMTIEEKNDLVLVSTEENITDWKFAKTGMMATDTDIVTYSFDVPKAGYYSFEGWLNANNYKWLSSSSITVDNTVLNLDEDTTYIKTSNGDYNYIVKKNVLNTEEKLWLDEGEHTISVTLSPRTSDNAQINARIWKFIFTLISEDDVYIPALNYEGTSAVSPVAATTAIGGKNMVYYSFKDDAKTDELILTYKFIAPVTAEYDFEGWASAIYSYLSAPEFYLDEAKLETVEDKNFKSDDGFVDKHSLSGIKLNGGQEYTVKVVFQPKISGGNINAKLWKMTFNRADAKRYQDVKVDNGSVKGSLYVEAQETEEDILLICAQYDDTTKALTYANAEKAHLAVSDLFTAVSFSIDMDASKGYSSEQDVRMFVLNFDSIAPLFKDIYIR